MFSQVSVHMGVSAALHAWMHIPPWADTPSGRHPPGRPPPGRHPHAGIWSTSGQYASHWNAFLLFGIIFAENCMKMKKLPPTLDPPLNTTCDWWRMHVLRKYCHEQILFLFLKRLEESFAFSFCSKEKLWKSHRLFRIWIEKTVVKANGEKKCTFQCVLFSWFLHKSLWLT